MRILLLLLLIVGCGRKELRYTQESVSVSTECKGDERQGFWCKATNKNGISTCYKGGDAGFSVSCKFYEGL
jgi:hypothetical protein